MAKLKKKDMLGIEYLDVDEIKLVLETSNSMKEISMRSIKKVPTLRGRTVVMFFYEPSTRTRVSFELAAKRLSADTLNISPTTSSAVKGESLLDTAKTLQAMNPDVVIIRHSCVGAPDIFSKIMDASIINAGDGCHEHPTQALLDMFTIKEKCGRIDGVKVAIIGDILHSRVARSNIWGLKKMGADVCVVGPPTLIPIDVEKLGVKVFYNIDEAIKDTDVIMLLRMQLERQKESLFPSLREYSHLFGIDMNRLKKAKKDVIIMHPGPMNRGVEISDEVADGPWSVITDQVTNGIAVRMAVLYLLMGGDNETNN